MKSKLILGCCALAAANLALAQNYPTRPVRMIVPFPPGGGNDILARAVGNRFTEVIGQQVVVDNRGGAGGLIGAQTAATAAPDGYTLFLGSVGNLAQIPSLRRDLPYHPLRDFAPVSLLATSAFVLAVHPGVAAKNVKELIALAKAKPGELNYASAGPGSSLHMAAELFKYATATDIVHVPYKGANAALTDLMTGRVQMIFSTMPPVLPHVKSGKLRGLAVTTAKRAAAAPDLPTVAESGVANFEVSNWQGVMVPIKTPKPLVQKLNSDFQKTLKLPGMTDTLAAQGLEPAGGTPEAFGALIKREIAKYTEVVKAAKIQVD
ncbi:MAG TPA: tripartite tricarboxylate transporter substrate binding protein [Burkholderiales bacterium]|nr:tripartite tricarboxylate transporter substrate binding protein [Burkholderiales bacterium]